MTLLWHCENVMCGDATPKGGVVAYAANIVTSSKRTKCTNSGHRKRRCEQPHSLAKRDGIISHFIGACANSRDIHWRLSEFDANNNSNSKTNLWMVALQLAAELDKHVIKGCVVATRPYTISER